MTEIDFTLVGGPTAVFTLAGLTFITDPTFDQPRSYPVPGEPTLVKTGGPALLSSELPHPDVVLLSHDHHADNLDAAGRELTSRVARVFTTIAGASRLGNGATGLSSYESAALAVTGGGTLTVTGVPAHHGPEGLWQVLGPVTGFVLTGEGLPTVYVSGDNSSLDLVEEITSKFGPIDLAVLFAGGAKLDGVMTGAFLTMPNEDILQAAKIMTSATIIPVHADGWAHFSQTKNELMEAFHRAGIGHRLLVVEPGDTARLVLHEGS